MLLEWIFSKLQYQQELSFEIVQNSKRDHLQNIKRKDIDIEKYWSRILGNKK